MAFTKMRILYRKWENWILSLFFVLLMLLLAGLRFDYYYDLNDDCRESTPDPVKAEMSRCCIR